METNSSYQKIQHQSPHKSIIYEQPTLSNDYIQVNLEKSQPHPQQMKLRRTTKYTYNEDSGSHTTIHNLNRHDGQMNQQTIALKKQTKINKKTTHTHQQINIT